MLRRALPGILLTLLGLLVIVHPGSWIDALEIRTVDFRTQYLPGRPTDQIVIVTVETKTLAEYGAWPISRKVYTELVPLLKKSGAKVIGFDLNFFRQQPGEDEAFGEAIRNAGNVVLGELFYPFGREPDGQDSDALAQGMTTYGTNPTNADLQCWNVKWFRPDSAPIRNAAVDNIGFANIVPDEHLMLHDAFMAMEYKGRLYPSFAVQVVRIYLGAPPLQITAAEAFVGTVRVPTDESTTLRINYRGGAHAFQVFSLVDVLQGRIPVDIFRGKIVLVGVSDGMAHDIWATPAGVTPGTDVLAHQIDTILSGIAIAPGRVADLLVLLTAGVGACWWLGRVRPVWVIPWTAAMVTALVVGETIAYAQLRMQLNMVSPTLVLLANCLWTVQRRLRSATA